jgi:hypothetical protein
MIFYRENHKKIANFGDLGIGWKIQQEVLGRTNCLLSFDTTSTAYEMKKKVKGEHTDIQT